MKYIGVPPSRNPYYSVASANVARVVAAATSWDNDAISFLERMNNGTREAVMQMIQGESSFLPALKKSSVDFAANLKQDKYLPCEVNLALFNVGGLAAMDMHWPPMFLAIQWMQSYGQEDLPKIKWGHFSDLTNDDNTNKFARAEINTHYLLNVGTHAELIRETYSVEESPGYLVVVGMMSIFPVEEFLVKPF